MQALPANRHFIEALDLKPVIMIRAIPDMLASYLDMLDADPVSPDNWLNIRVPENYASRGDPEKADFIVDMFGPWYASYFATWLDYAAAAPERVCILDYDDFREDPVTALERLLAHSGLPRSAEACRIALDAVWEDRESFRFNKGVPGRGAARFTPGPDRTVGNTDCFLSQPERDARHAYSAALSFFAGACAFRSGLRYWPV